MSTSTIHKNANVVQHARPSMGSWTLDIKILRGLFATPGGDDEAACKNFHAFTDSGIELGDEADIRIVDYVRDFHASHGGGKAPELSLAKEFLEQADEAEAVDRLGSASKQVFYAFENYRSICENSRRHQQNGRFIHLAREAATIAEHGKIMDTPEGRKTLRGAEDAAQFLLGSLDTLGGAVTARRRTLASVIETVKEKAVQPKFSTGVATLDDALGGGFPTQIIHIVTAPPGNFKSSWLSYLALRFARAGHPVAYVSADEGPSRTVERMMRMAGGAELPIHFSDGESVIEIEAAFIAAEAAKASRAAAVEAIRRSRHLERDLTDDSVIEHTIRRDGLRRVPVMVLDSVQCISTGASSRIRDEYGRINDIMNVMRRLAEKHGMIIVAASEANRSAYRAKKDDENATGLSAGKGSSSIEYKADVPITLKKSRDEQGGVVIRGRVEKNRLGPSEPEFALKFDGQTFVEIGLPEPVGFDDSHVLVEVLKKHKVKTTRELYVACKQDGRVSSHQRIDDALAKLRLNGCVTGGKGERLVAVSTEIVL